MPKGSMVGSSLPSVSLIRTKTFFKLLIIPAILGLVSSCSTHRQTYTVMTYNMHIGVGMDGVRDMERIAAVIDSSDADLVVLNEVDKGTTRSLQMHQVDSLGTLLDMEYRFGRSINHDGGEYGNALLSNYPILNFQVHDLETEYGFEDRTVFHAQIFLDPDTLHLLGTHLGLDTLERIDQVNVILEVLPDSPHTILAGDFNFEPGSAPYAMISQKLSDALLTLTKKPTNTFPADYPDRRIDYIFVGSGIAVELEPAPESKLISVASDHRPQAIKFKLY